MRYLVLCTGNRCRSQMAHGILQHLHPDAFTWSEEQVLEEFRRVRDEIRSAMSKLM